MATDLARRASLRAAVLATKRRDCETQQRNAARGALAEATVRDPSSQRALSQLDLALQSAARTGAPEPIVVTFVERALGNHPALFEEFLRELERSLR